jgi:hypothetical protein
MKQTLYKHASLSLVLITLWMLYVTFNHITDLDESGFRYFGLWIDFIYSCMAGAGLGILLLLARLLYFRQLRSRVLQGTLVYLLVGLFNSYLVVIWIICLATGLLELDTDFAIGMMAVVVINASFILTDIYRAIFRPEAIAVSGND